VRAREALDWARKRLQAAARGTVGLGQGEDDVVAGGHEAGQSSLGELRGARED